ncbi:MFS transporter [Sphingomonas bacterium]|uniref:MFS transporter n=1 Tax=Sphingomonas bacterium TaxID=1895847 RepID=UPI0020C5B414|nr:MFS transporter [Sphingomonas bacterium]
MDLAPPLTRWLKVMFALGSSAESIVLTVSGGFLLLYYNQVRGVPAGWVGLALAAGLVVNALFDPLVGSWSDRTTSRWGRRHPFMFASIVPAAVLFYAVFNPPAELGLAGQAVWLCVVNVLLVQAMTIFHTPHLAFGGELSEDYLERTNVMSYNMFFLWIGDTSGWLLSLALFFRPSARYPNGALDPTAWPGFTVTVAAIILACLAVSSWFTRSRIPYLPVKAADAPRFGAREFLRDVGRALSNRNYVVLLIGFFFLSLMTGVRNGLWIYTATFLWRLTSAQISFFVIGSLCGYVFGSLAVTALHRRFDKRWTTMIALTVFCIGPALPLALGRLSVMTPVTPLLLPILIAFSLFQHAPYSILTTTIYSALADIADENELRYGVRQEGVLYSTRTLFAKMDQAIGTALAGWVLTIIAFPAKAVPGQVPHGVLMGLATAFVLSTLPGLVALIFYGMLGVSRASHDATRAALDLRPRTV